ncbi:MAG: hypothetical protein B6U97_04740 [Candidatus Altiarchaeales archaeon ex4484_96]|nr:MAG: hypothetical protein B6U97_04740 [Candidatus Altiarchaeales archaeon ex4484_96]
MKDKGNKKRVLKVVFVVLLVFFIAAAGGLIWFASDKVSEPYTYVTKQKRTLSESTFYSNEVVRFPSSANVTKPNSSSGIIKVGIDPGTTALNFGRVFPDMPVRKYLELKNSEKQSVKVCVRKYGSIAPYLNTSTDSFILEPGQQRSVMVSFTGKELGSFSGEVDVYIRKLKYPQLTFLLEWVGC